MSSRSLSARSLPVHLHSALGSPPKGPREYAQDMVRPTLNEPIGCPWWDEDRLRELLVERGLTYDAAANECGCHPETVRKWASRYGIVREASA